MIFANAFHKIIFLTWPRWRGLLVFGLGDSMRTSCPFFSIVVVLLVIVLRTKLGLNDMFIYGHFASRVYVDLSPWGIEGSSEFKIQLFVCFPGFFVVPPQNDNAICTGDCPRVLAREKQGKARSAHSPCGGISIRSMICSWVSSGICGARISAKQDLKGSMYIKW